MIRREIEGTLAALLGKYPAVNVTGPRQSGKLPLPLTLTLPLTLPLTLTY